MIGFMYCNAIWCEINENENFVLTTVRIGPAACLAVAVSFYCTKKS